MDKKSALPDFKKRISNSKAIGENLYGKKKWDLIIENINGMSPCFAKLIQEIPYGSIYPRENLSLKSKEIIAISTLTQLNLKPQLKSHLIAALNVGLTKKEIIEVFIHLAMFIGFPLVLSGLSMAKEVFDNYNL